MSGGATPSRKCVNGIFESPQLLWMPRDNAMMMDASFCIHITCGSLVIATNRILVR